MTSGQLELVPDSHGEIMLVRLINGISNRQRHAFDTLVVI